MSYRKAEAQLDGVMEECDSLFNRFLAVSADGACLRLLFAADERPDMGPHWIDLDLDRLERRSQETGVTAIDVADAYFDAVLCTGLEHVSRPSRLTREIWRVLKPGGQIWVQAALNAPYLPPGPQARTEYWRIAPDGLRMLLEGYDEVFCSVYLPLGSALRTCSFYYGLKPPREPGDPVIADPSPLPVLG